jgi:hypothetical protein
MLVNIAQEAIVKPYWLIREGITLILTSNLEKQVGWWG